MRVVLDTNVLVSALIVKVGKPAQILRRVGEFELLTSEEILAETEKVLYYEHIQKRYHPTEEDIKSFIRNLRDVGEVIRVRSKVEVIKEDPDDNKFLACGLDGGADFIVSGDPHLTELKEYKGIEIISPARFLELITDVWRSRTPG
jgi:hypothetical protein